MEVFSKTVGGDLKEKSCCSLQSRILIKFPLDFLMSSLTMIVLSLTTLLSLLSFLMSDSVNPLLSVCVYHSVVSDSL